MRTLKEFDFWASVPFLLVHIVSIVGVFLVPFSWTAVAICIGLFYLRMFGITAGYHRYFSHKTYKMGRFSQFLMALLGTLSVQKGVLWWAAHHRHHHQASDRPDDIHSPVQDGFWWSHVGWILSKRYTETQFSAIPDFAKFPELQWLNRHYLIPPIAMAVLIYLIGGSTHLIWGFFVSTTLLWHGTFTINSLSHVWGRVRFVSNDTSRNNWVLAIVTMGEGWHNNHHAYAVSTRQGFYWWEVDMSYLVLRALSKVGIVWDIKEPPLQALLEKKGIAHASAVAPEPELAETKSAPELVASGE